MDSVPRKPAPAKPRPTSRRRRTIAAAVPASHWPKWTDRPFDAVVGAIYVAALAEGGAR